MPTLRRAGSGGRSIVHVARVKGLPLGAGLRGVAAGRLEAGCPRGAARCLQGPDCCGLSATDEDGIRFSGTHGRLRAAAQGEHGQWAIEVPGGQSEATGPWIGEATAAAGATSTGVVFVGVGRVKAGDADVGATEPSRSATGGWPVGLWEHEASRGPRGHPIRGASRMPRRHGSGCWLDDWRRQERACRGDPKRRRRARLGAQLNSVPSGGPRGGGRRVLVGQT